MYADVCVDEIPRKALHGREQTIIATNHYAEPKSPQQVGSSTIQLEGTAAATVKTRGSFIDRLNNTYCIKMFNMRK